MTRIVENVIKCRKCGEVIRSRYTHDFKMCKCGSCGVDGGRAYLRRVGLPEDFIELSVCKEDSNEKK